MKNRLFGIVAVTSVVAGTAFGDVYFDPTGDIATGNANLDLTQVEITDNGTDLFITVTVAALDADWGKYLFFANHSPGGSGDNDNPWARDVAGLSGMDAFIGSWLDGGGGAQWWNHDGSAWALDGVAPGLSIDFGSNSFTWTVAGLVTTMQTAGITGFDFEVATTGGGGGDPAIDLLGGEGTQPGWGQGSTSIDLMHYDFSFVPAPSVLAMLLIGGLNRRRRS